MEDSKACKFSLKIACIIMHGPDPAKTHFQSQLISPGRDYSTSLLCTIGIIGFKWRLAVSSVTFLLVKCIIWPTCVLI